MKFKRSKVYLHRSSVFNNKTHKGICCMCLEVANFRHVMYDGKNALMCTRCLAGKLLDRRFSWRTYMCVDKMTIATYLLRTMYRVKRFFFGDWLHKPFNRGKKC